MRHKVFMMWKGYVLLLKMEKEGIFICYVMKLNRSSLDCNLWGVSGFS